MHFSVLVDIRQYYTYRISAIYSDIAFGTKKREKHTVPPIRLLLVRKIFGE